jgi:hypothetical protein
MTKWLLGSLIATLAIAPLALAQDSDDAAKKKIEALEKQLAELRQTVEELKTQQSAPAASVELDRAIADLSSRVEARQGSAAKGGPNMYAPGVKSLTFTFEDRVRAEAYRNRTFGARKTTLPAGPPLVTSVSPNNPTGTTAGSIVGTPGNNEEQLDDAYRILNRFRMNMKADVNDKLAAFAQFQFSNTWGASPGAGSAAGGSLLPNAPITNYVAPVGPGALATSEQTAAGAGAIGFHQLYVVFKDLQDSQVDFTVGRFGLKLGDGRILSDAEWDNVGRSFDGVKVEYAQDQIAVTAFASAVVQGALDFKAQDTWLLGGWVDISPAEGVKITPYTLYVADNSQPNQLLVGATPVPLMVGSPWTIGSYLEFSVVDTGLKFLGQFHMQQDDKRPNTPIPHAKNVDFAEAIAWGLGAELEVPIDEAKNYRPMVGLEFTQATKFFNDLYGERHGFWGISDVVNTWNNVTDLKLYAGATPHTDVKVGIAYHMMRLTQNPGSSPFDATPSSQVSKNLGQELDLTADIRCTDNINVGLGWGHFFNQFSLQEGAFVPGAAYATTVNSNSAGQRKDADFLFMQLTVKF